MAGVELGSVDFGVVLGVPDAFLAPLICGVLKLFQVSEQYKRISL